MTKRGLRIKCSYWDNKVFTCSHCVSFGRPEVRITLPLKDPPLAQTLYSRPIEGRATPIHVGEYGVLQMPPFSLQCGVRACQTTTSSIQYTRAHYLKGQCAQSFEMFLLNVDSKKNQANENSSTLNKTAELVLL